MAQTFIDKRQQSVKRFQRARDYWRQHGAEWVNGLAVFFGILAGWLIGISLFGWLIFITAVALAVWAYRLSNRTSHEISVLHEDNERLRKESKSEAEALRNLLQQLAVQLLKENGLWTNTCRLSIYGHRNNLFYLICRVSANPDYAKGNRETYPDSEGHIGLCWRERVISLVWPKSPESPKAKNAALQLGMSEDVYDKLVLKPKAMRGTRVDDNNDRPIGIILIETENRDELPAFVSEEDNRPDLFDEVSPGNPLYETIVATESVFEPLGKK